MAPATPAAGPAPDHAFAPATPPPGRPERGAAPIPGTALTVLPPRRGCLSPALLLPAALAALLILGSVAVAIWSLRQPPHAEPPPLPATAAASTARIDAPFAPDTLRPLSPAQAIAANAARPAVTATVDPAARFLLPTTRATDVQRSLECLTTAIYYEAGSQSDDGERAVAQVILNRVRHPAYPKTVCGVVFDGAQRRTGCQFTFACDGSLARAPSPAGWQRATRIAAAALAGAVFAPVGWATHYHADYVVPYWASTLVKVATVGAHIFYRWDGVAGNARAFGGRYAGGEPALPDLLQLTGPRQETAAASATGAGVSAGGTVAAAERPVLTGVREGNDVRTVTLGERRVLPGSATDAPDAAGTAAAAPVGAARRVLPAGDGG